MALSDCSQEDGAASAVAEEGAAGSGGARDGDRAEIGGERVGDLPAGEERGPEIGQPESDGEGGGGNGLPGGVRDRAARGNDADEAGGAAGVEEKTGEGRGVAAELAESEKRGARKEGAREQVSASMRVRWKAALGQLEHKIVLDIRRPASWSKRACFARAYC